MRNLVGLLAGVALLVATTVSSQAKPGGYSGGGRSYSSHSFSSGGSHGFSFSRSSGGGSSWSSGGSKSVSSGGGKSYSSGSSWGGSGGHSYSSGKSFSSSAVDRWFKPSGSGSKSSRTFDTAAAMARKQDASRDTFNAFKSSQAPPRLPNSVPPIIPGETRRSSTFRPTVYVPDWNTLYTRPVRIRSIFSPYYSRPVIVYHDPYSSFFWWWLLDQSLDNRAWWAYHHHYDMDPGRYQALMASDAQLQARVAQLEAQQVARDPNYVPTGLDHDLMYSDQYVSRTYSNRPTLLGVIAFWALAVPLAVAFCVFFIWLIWFKRWQSAATA